jgi:hypothetical protein
MNSSKHFSLLVASVCFMGFIAAHGQNANPVNVITTSVPFLRLSNDARAGGMGETGIATTPDANAIYWNVGKLPFNEGKGAVVAGYTPWLPGAGNDMYHASLSGYCKADESGALHAVLNYFSLGDLQFKDNSGNHLQAFHPREWSAAVGYSKKISDRSGIGISLKFIYSNLSNKAVEGNTYKAGTAQAADLGYYLNLLRADGEGWTFGAVLSNLGSKIDYSSNASQKDFIPANFGLGTSYTKLIDRQNKFNFALDINKLLVPTPPAAGDTAALLAYRNKSVVGSWFSSFGDAPGGFSEELREFQLSLGAEYWYNNQFALRAGYFYESPQKGNRNFFTAGTSVQYKMITANFSYAAPTGNSLTRNPMMNTLRFGLQFEFSK